MTAILQTDTLSEKIGSKKWVFWLDRTHPGKDPGTFRVSIVIENEAGHYPTGGGEADPHKAPWWWDEETCRRENLKRGFDVMQAYEVVASSMGASILEKRMRHIY